MSKRRVTFSNPFYHHEHGLYRTQTEYDIPDNVVLPKTGVNYLKGGPEHDPTVVATQDPVSAPQEPQDWSSEEAGEDTASQDSGDKTSSGRRGRPGARRNKSTSP